MTTATEVKVTEQFYKISHNIPTERISDLLCSAFEGGSNYWIRSGRRKGFEGYLQDVAFHSDGAVFIKTTEDGPKEFRLDRVAIMKGLALMAEKHPRHFGDFLAEHDDADTGDVFIQLALFGEVLYG